MKIIRLVSFLSVICILAYSSSISFSSASSKSETRHHKFHHMKMKAKMNKRFFNMMKKFDLNGDKRITSYEITAVQNKTMNDHDTNKSGSLSLDEFQILWSEITRRRMVRAFQRTDTNGDAQISMEELNERMDRIVSRMDRNNDVILSKDDKRKRKRR